MDKETIGGFDSKQTKVDPETGSIEWDITYKANFGLLYKDFKKLIKEFRAFIHFDEVKDDTKLHKLYESINSSWNSFRSHLRSEYPKQYSKLQSITEEEIKNIIKKTLMKEMSTTGPGAAHFEPGQSENYPTKFAFKKTKNLKENQESSEQYINSLNLTDPQLKNFITKRINDFNTIEDKLNILLPLLQKAKKETMEFYKNKPSFDIKYGSDLAVDYINDIITLFQDKKEQK